MAAFKDTTFKANLTRVLAVSALACACASFAIPALAAESSASVPNPQEQAELAKFASYNGTIEVIASNDGNGLHAFLNENTGKTVFIETTVLRYKPTPEGVTAETRDRMPPTDRFENPVFLKCWGEEANKDGRLESGETGFPLPVGQADIDAGCATRIKIELAEGDYGPNTDHAFGLDKKETYFIGFFEVKKESLEGGKALYRLAEVSQPEETAAAFYKHATKKDRSMRELSIEAAQPAAGNSE